MIPQAQKNPLLSRFFEKDSSWEWLSDRVISQHVLLPYFYSHFESIPILFIFSPNKIVKEDLSCLWSKYSG